MKAKNVAMLLRKDLRMSKWVFVAGLGLWLAPTLISILYGMTIGIPTYMLSDLVTDSLGRFGSMLLILSVPMIVGHVLASERTDRSAAFLAYMPFTRSEAVAGKAICAILLSGILLALCASPYAVSVVDVVRRNWPNIAKLPDIKWYQVVMCVVEVIGWHVGKTTGLVLAGVTIAFGSAWLTGIAFRSAAMATVLGVATPLLVGGGIFIYDSMAHRNEHSTTDLSRMLEQSQWHYMQWSVVLGVVFFVAGTIVYMKRRTDE